MEGNLYNFYYKMGLHLRNSPYVNTLNMCEEKCKTLNPSKYKKNPFASTMKKNIFQKVQNSISNFGIKETIKIIIKKLRRR